MNEDEILLKLNYYCKEIEGSLDTVKTFIINNKILITGGMAIDLALRLKNSSIYNEFTIPDYDCISYQNYEVSKELTEILCKLNYPDVSMMPAIHQTTLRVKVCDYTILDCTYLPKDIYDKIPTIDVNGFKVVHPTFIKIAQLKSMSFLFSTTGEGYNIFYRLKKDYQRNDLLNKYYPLPIVKDINKKNHIHRIDMKLLNLQTSLSTKVYQKDKLLYSSNNFNDEKIIEHMNKQDTFLNTDNSICLGPYLSYLCYMNDGSITIKNNELVFKSYENLTPTLIVSDNDYTKKIITFMKNTKPKYYNRVGDYIPEVIKFDNILKLYELYGDRLACNIKRIENYNLLLCSPCYCLCIFLYYYMIHKDDFYLSMYNNILHLLKDEISFPLSTFKSNNMNELEEFYIKKLKGADISKELPAPLYTDYPKCNDEKTFNYSLSNLYKIDGSEKI